MLQPRRIAMTARNTGDTDNALRASRIAVLAAAMLITCPTWFGSADAVAAGTYCSDTARTLKRACGFEVQDDYWVAVAKCINEVDDTDRAQCNADAAESRSEGDRLCREQLLERQGACASLGEARYHPEFEPRQFDSNFARLSNPNRYFPLRIGNRWEYRGGTEIVTVEVLNETKLIDDVRCIVVRDLVTDDGELIEATDDWFAQAKDGNVWYCGEEVKNYETFEGDLPQNPELVDVDGSFKTDRDEDQPGIIFKAHPVVGEAYREEFSLGNAEDIAEILSTTYAFGTDGELDRFVPRRLAQLLCHGDCIVTSNFNLLEPGIIERKYHAPGIGVFLEVHTESGEVTQLTNCNFDNRCRSLPRP